MRTFARLLAAFLMISFAQAAPVRADQLRHIVDTAQLTQALEQKTGTRDADRAAVREALGRAEVRQIATRLGIDLERLTASVDTIEASDLSRAAEAARRTNQALIGGANVTISTTTIIIALLIVILIIVAVK
jgi:hypothetical protein